MKKLLILLAAGAFCVGLRASTIDWAYSGDIWDSTGADGANGSVWVLALGSGADASSIYVDDTGAIKYGDGISVSATGVVDTGALAMDSKTVATAAGDYVLVFADTAGQTYGKTSAYTVTPSSTDASVLDSFDFGDPDGIGDWSEITLSTAWKSSGGGGGSGVPEPTSGLLLVVGGAMLALRRKQR